MYEIIHFSLTIRDSRLKNILFVVPEFCGPDSDSAWRYFNYISDRYYNSIATLAFWFPSTVLRSFLQANPRKSSTLSQINFSKFLKFPVIVIFMSRGKTFNLPISTRLNPMKIEKCLLCVSRLNVENRTSYPTKFLAAPWKNDTEIGFALESKLWKTGVQEWAHSIPCDT